VHAIVAPGTQAVAPVEVEPVELDVVVLDPPVPLESMTAPPHARGESIVMKESAWIVFMRRTVAPPLSGDVALPVMMRSEK
jgi:hypothetical protein